MEKWHRAAIVIMVVGILIFCSEHSNAASKNAYQNVLVEILELGPATYLKISAHGKTAADVDKRLADSQFVLTGAACV